MFHISPEFYYIIIFSLISFLIGYLSSVKKIDLNGLQKTAVKAKKAETVKTPKDLKQNKVTPPNKVVQSPVVQSKKAPKKQIEEDNDEDRLDFNTIVPGQIRAIKTIDRKRKIEIIDKKTIDKNKEDSIDTDF